MDKAVLNKMNIPAEVRAALETANVTIPVSRNQMLDITFGGPDTDLFEVAYDVPGKGRYLEATVARCKNGAAVNYTEAYMRRRDPDAMVISDDLPTDKTRFIDRFGKPFGPIRQETFDWLGQQGDVTILPFLSGDKKRGFPSLLIAPANAGFFVTGLADLQGFIPRDEVPEGFTPEGILYLAPPFRHTHFDGKQLVVHNRSESLHELFCYNLYPGPSAKKGVYSILLTRGERENWTTLHSSAVRLITPYDHEFVILHEGASGGGKSEMTQAVHREADGRIVLARNTITREELHLELVDTCELHPVSDDMSLAHPSIQTGNNKLVIEDAEAGWFLRVDHLTEYGTEPNLEKLTIQPPEPLIFLNVDGKPNSTALIWEHTMDAPGKPCPNPRVIMPRHFIENIVDTPVEVDVRSFGVRTPPSTRKVPNYGILGILHILPPSLGWLWRLVAPRGHSNPSIVTAEGLSSEGVGSYWPFATGKMVTQANLLLDLTFKTRETKYVLIPNQYIGAFKVGFMGEWLSREFLARRGGVQFREGVLDEARCPLLGWTVPNMRVNGQAIPRGLLVVHEQQEVGEDGYDAGAAILKEFFHKEIRQFLTPELSALGREIIECCLDDGSVKNYQDLMP